MTTAELVVGNHHYIKINKPFNKRIGDGIHKYKVVNISLLKDINTYNPYTAIYEPHQIDITTYDTHVQSGVQIVELVDCLGKRIYVPDAAIVVYASEDMVEYVNKTMLVTMGLLRTDLDLDLLKKDVESLVMKHTGVKPVIVIADTSPITLLDGLQHTNLEAARDTTTQYSCETRYTTLESMYNEVRSKNQVLMQFIEDHCDGTC